jgi:hypothetical protein
MAQVFDRLATAPCAKWTLGGALLVAAVLAIVVPMSRAADAQGGAQPYVPASSTWVDLGTPHGADGGIAAEVLRSAAANATVSHAETTQAHAQTRMRPQRAVRAHRLSGNAARPRVGSNARAVQALRSGSHALAGRSKHDPGAHRDG